MPDGVPKVRLPLLGTEVPIKYLSLLVLVLQNTSLALIVKGSQTADRVPYLSTSAVVTSELMKMTICLVIIATSDPRGLTTVLHEEIVGKPVETLKLLVPAGLYTLQNNLAYVAIANLQPAMYQVTYQMKIITTALFSVAMLGKELNRTKWFSLLMLVFGVAMVQIKTGGGGGGNDAGEGNLFVGLTAVLTACVSSGFAGVYFEKILKGTGSSIWLRNVQLGLFGVMFGLFGVWSKDGDKVAERGFFQGYDWLVWTVVANQAAGGLIVAVVVKYADNIMKGFATSLAIILSSIFSYMFFNFEITPQFTLGAALVIYSVYLYGKPEAPPSVGLPKV